MRTTAKLMAKDAGIGKEVHDALNGHSGGGGRICGGGVGRAYGGGFGLKALAEALGRIGVPEAVRGLTWALGR